MSRMSQRGWTVSPSQPVNMSVADPWLLRSFQNSVTLKDVKTKDILGNHVLQAKLYEAPRAFCSTWLPFQAALSTSSKIEDLRWPVVASKRRAEGFLDRGQRRIDAKCHHGVALATFLTNYSGHKCDQIDANSIELQHEVGLEAISCPLRLVLRPQFKPRV